MRIRHRILFVYILINIIFWWPTSASAATVQSEPIATPQVKETLVIPPALEIQVPDSVQELELVSNTAIAYGGSTTAGNGYEYHSCTWYAKERRPDLPNNLGNADTWFSRASAQGIPTGYTPKAGAIGQQGMHVVYIERVNEDGSVYLSERNWDYNGSFRYRTASGGDFIYIY